MPQEEGDKLGCLTQIMGGLDQEDFKIAVVKEDVIQLDHAADRERIDHPAEDVGTRIVDAIQKDRCLDRLDAGQGLEALEDIGKMAQDFFQLAPGSIGGFREGPEAGHIAEMAGQEPGVLRHHFGGQVLAKAGGAAAHLTDIDGIGYPLDHILGGLDGIG